MKQNEEIHDAAQVKHTQAKECKEKPDGQSQATDPHGQVEVQEPTQGTEVEGQVDDPDALKRELDRKSQLIDSLIHELASRTKE